MLMGILLPIVYSGPVLPRNNERAPCRRGTVLCTVARTRRLMEWTIDTVDVIERVEMMHRRRSWFILLAHVWLAVVTYTWRIDTGVVRSLCLPLQQIAIVSAKLCIAITRFHRLIFLWQRITTTLLDPIRIWTSTRQTFCRGWSDRRRVYSNVLIERVKCRTLRENARREIVAHAELLVLQQEPRQQMPR